MINIDFFHSLNKNKQMTFLCVRTRVCVRVAACVMHVCVKVCVCQ